MAKIEAIETARLSDSRLKMRNGKQCYKKQKQTTHERRGKERSKFCGRTHTNISKI
jgi:hypothetical protein